MGVPDYLTCLLRKLYAGQEATVRTGYGKTDWFQIGKGDLDYKTITGEAYKHVVQHLFTCFSYLGLPKVLKTDNAPLKLRRDCLITLNDFQNLLGDIN